MPDRMSRVAKNKRAGRLKKAQHVDDRVLDVARGDSDGAVLNIGMTTFVARDLEAKGPVAARGMWATAKDALIQEYGNVTIDDLLTQFQGLKP